MIQLGPDPNCIIFEKMFAPVANFFHFCVYAFVKRFKNDKVYHVKVLKMKKILLPIVLAAALVTAIASAQTLKDKPEKIVTFIKTQHDAEWYARQATLWEKEVKKNPDNDDAWYYWFTATRYYHMFKESDEDVCDKALTDIAYRLHKERPESYARYIIDYECSHFVSYKNRPDDLQDNMLKAIQMRPDFESLYPRYVVYLTQTGRTDLLSGILKKWYESGDYSYATLAFFYNALAGMEENGILFVGGDIDTFSPLMIQYGKGLFQDRIVINKNMLWEPEYRKTIFRQLDLEPYEGPEAFRDQKEMDQWLDNLIFYIAQNSGRTVYFSSTLSSQNYREFLYSEGLINRYSTRRYDNLSAKRRNFESVYLTDYLLESFSADTFDDHAYKLSLNYIANFKSLLDYYKAQGLKSEYDKLRRIMIHIVDMYKEHICDPNSKEDQYLLKHYYDEIDR